jgi:hypothetical protein
MAVRYRCSGCGNLTRFDVVSSRRTRAFHHFTVGGDLEIEDEVVLEASVESVTCRWCGATGATIKELPVDTIGTVAGAVDSRDEEAAPGG